MTGKSGILTEAAAIGVMSAAIALTKVMDPPTTRSPSVPGGLQPEMLDSLVPGLHLSAS